MLKCQYCYFGTIHKSLMDDHILKSHTVSEENSKLNGFKCSTCSKTFPTSNKLRFHATECQDFDTLGYVSYYHLSDGKQAGCHQCGSCGLILRMRQSAISHMKLVHSKDETVAFCFICCITFLTLKEMKIHNVLKHETKKNIICGECDQSFPTKRGIKSHFQIHGNLCKNLICDICLERKLLKYFADNTKLKSHVEIEHSCDERTVENGGEVKQEELIIKSDEDSFSN